MMMKPFGYFDLIEHFSKPGCVVCNLLLRDVHKLLDALLYEFAADGEMLHNFRASRGLCNQHSWQLTRMGNILGITILYEVALDEVLKVLHQTAPDGSSQPNFARRLFSQTSNTALVDALQPTQPCIACKTASTGEIQYIRALSQHIAEEKMQDAYRASDGLCLEHFKLVLHNTPDAKDSRLFVQLQSEIWGRLRQELRDLIRKYDFSHADEAIKSEGDSWRRAVARLVGEKGVFGIRRPKT